MEAANRTRRLRCALQRLLWMAALGGAVCAASCRSLDVDSARRLARISNLGKSQALSVRKHAKNPLSDQLKLMTFKGPKPTPRTQQFLRRFDLQRRYEQDPDDCLLGLMDVVQREQSLEAMHALAEIAYVEGERSRIRGAKDRSSKMYATALIASYRYLFDPGLPDLRNAYDPEFRRACDIYNQSLEGILRFIERAGKLQPGSQHTFDLYGTPIEFVIHVDGPWDEADLGHFKFASDYETKGLTNLYNTYGLGVPLIGVRESAEQRKAWEQYYPSGLTFPVTAFLELAPDSATDKGGRAQCVLHLYDPLRTTVIAIGDRSAPLESDITTPLAYFLNDPLLNSRLLPTFSLVNASLVQNFSGLYMLEPYDPSKIPVVMVHGLWSTPVTWTEMFNDLRSMPEIRDRYQFWFYLYPSGQPFWLSALQMRQDLQQAYQTLDPRHESEALHQTVLVGHSMGGLISHLQTIHSGDDFWRLVSDQPIDRLQGDPQTLQEIAGLFFFEPNESVKRVITIGTPHRGSAYATSTAQWLGQKVVEIPDLLTSATDEIVRDNKDLIRDPAILDTKTSIESLAPDAPFFSAMLQAERGPWTHFHNIMGNAPLESWVLRAIVDEVPGDGVVSLTSATNPLAESEIEVAEYHSNLHRHPLAILEVRRILLEHLRSLPPAGSEIRLTDYATPAPLGAATISPASPGDAPQ